MSKLEQTAPLIKKISVQAQYAKKIIINFKKKLISSYNGVIPILSENSDAVDCLRELQERVPQQALENEVNDEAAELTPRSSTLYSRQLASYLKVEELQKASERRASH